MERNCIKCGCVTVRYADGRCKPCADRGSAAYRKANAEQVKAQKLAYCAANRDSEKTRASTWRAANLDRATKFLLMEPDR